MYSITPIDPTIKIAYVGHTTNFRSRKSQHKRTCINTNDPNHNCKTYQLIREHKGFDYWEMKPLEECECENKTQARIRERYWYEKFIADGYEMGNSVEPFVSDGNKEEFKKGGAYYEKYYSKDGTLYQANLEKAKERSKSVKLLKEENKRLKKLLDDNGITY